MADNRAEASRLWQMMNRGGQMGMNVAADPLAYAGGASVVNPVDSMYQSYNPAGGWAEAGRLAPDNIAAANVAAMNQVSLPYGGIPSDLHGGGAPSYYRDHPEMTPLDASVVAPPRMPTAGETVRGVMGPANERDSAFSRIHDAYYTGADFGYEQGWPERLDVPTEYIDLYMAVPDKAKQYAHDNPTDSVLQQFEEKYGFPLDVSIEISM